MDIEMDMGSFASLVRIMLLLACLAWCLYRCWLWCSLLIISEYMGLPVGVAPF